MSILIVSNLDRSHRSICTLSGRPRLRGESLFLSFCKLLQNYILCIIIIATLKARKERVHLFIKNRYLKWNDFSSKLYFMYNNYCNTESKKRKSPFTKNRYLSLKWFFFKFYSNATVMTIVMNRFTKPLHGVWRVSWKINICVLYFFCFRIN